jgi:hypothetical protein
MSTKLFSIWMASNALALAVAQAAPYDLCKRAAEKAVVQAEEGNAEFGAILEANTVADNRVYEVSFTQGEQCVSSYRVTTRRSRDRKRCEVLRLERRASDCG